MLIKDSGFIFGHEVQFSLTVWCFVELWFFFFALLTKVLISFELRTHLEASKTGAGSACVAFGEQLLKPHCVLSKLPLYLLLLWLAVNMLYITHFVAMLAYSSVFHRITH